MVRIAPDDTRLDDVEADDVEQDGDVAPRRDSAGATRATAAVRRVAVVPATPDDVDDDGWFEGVEDATEPLVVHHVDRAIKVRGVRLRSLVRMSAVLWVLTTAVQVLVALTAWLAVERLGWVTNAEGVAADLLSRESVSIDLGAVVIVAIVLSMVVSSLLLVGAWVVTALWNLVGRFGGGPVLRVRAFADDEPTP